MVMMPLARHSSNKENTVPRQPLSAACKHKAGVLGLGKGLPTRRRLKRATSVQRAKAANSKAKVANKKPATTPTATPTQPAPSSAGYVKIPRQLARPLLPSIAELEIGGDLVPAAYVRDQLAKILSGLLLVGAMFRPFPSVLSNMTEGRKSFAFGVPPLIKGQVQDPNFVARIRGYEPDLCLALRKPGSDSLELVPIHRLVYAAQCAYFPTLPLDSVQQSKALETIAEDVGVSGEELSQADFDDSASDVSDASAASEELYADAGPYRHLPLLCLEVPSPETWQHLHVRLHSSDNYVWQRSLLDTPEASTPEEAKKALMGMSGEDLQKRLVTVHGVWQNCCALGVTNDKIWEQLASAWALVVDVLVARASRSS